MSFAAYDVSLELLRVLAPLVPAIKKHDRDLADQMRRAATSVVLNINEGRRRCGGDQRRSFEIANGSAHEVLAAIDAAVAWGWLDDAAVARQLLDRILAMLWRLTH
jgi:four helix bundle protein